jgi:hypothetical protein
MAVQVVWDDDAHTILRYVYPRHWMWNEAYAAINQTRKMMASATNPVDCIVDMRESLGIPVGNAIIQLRKMGEMGQNMTNYSGLTVFVKADTFLKALLQVYERVYPDQADKLVLPHVRTLDEAHEFIQKQRKLQT